MLPIETAFPLYVDLDGKPLDNGYIYFGQVDQNPITNPVTVYWDADGTQPAAQPIRTQDGYIVRNGTPANVFYSAAYSQLVQDKRNQQIYYAADSTDYSEAAYVQESIEQFSSAIGSSLIGFTQSGMGATQRSVQSKLRDIVSVNDFGAIGDGTLHQLSERFATLSAAQSFYPHATALTNSIDWAAIQGAINYAILSNKALYVPPGTYIAGNLIYSSSSAHATIYGGGSGNTIIKNTIDTTPVLTISGGANQLNVTGIMFSGNGTVTNWGSGDGVAGNNLVGTIPTSSAAVSMIDLVHATFHDCYFINAVWGADIQGGIAVTFTSCYAYWNAQVGYRIYRNGTSSGWPNVITLRDSSAVENGQVGVYFDDGRQLVIQGGHYEGNGKNTVQAPGVACGVFIGSNTGIENGATNGPNSTPFHTMAASISDVWFEQNGNNNGSGVPNGASMAHIIHQHGELVIGGRCIFTNSTAGRNIRINGGQYKIEDCSFESNLTVSTNYIDEGGTSGVANLISGNYINRCTFGSAGAKLTAANCTVDQSKTYFDYSRYAPTKTISGLGTTSSGTFTVTWPAGTWQTTPNVVAQVYTNDSGTTTYSAEVYGVSTTGFTVRAKQNAAGVVTQPAITAMWIANGT